MELAEDIVISGISGRYPECNNIDELMEALLKGVDLINDEERRFPKGVMDIPPRMGKLPELDKFDSTFFGVHAKQAEFMDPRHRILLETVYECIVDAGYNPQELRGTKTGVYVGMTMFNNLEKMREREDSDGYLNIGFCMALAANRISYCFDFKGKSYTVDTACSSTMYGLVNAIDDIKSGKVNAAVICGASAIFHPHETSEFLKLNMLAPDGKSKVFSTVRDGYGRSEAICSLLLQKKSASRRVYATVLGAACNCDGYKVEGITYPSTEVQLKLMQEIYLNENINPDEVAYVEAHGTGTPIGDTVELEAIVSMLCKTRKTSLPIGAVKSNMGHAEIASGLCSVSKVIIAMETGVIPANLHIDSLDTDLPGISEGKIKVVTENLPWYGGIVALNCFGFGGANAHVVLKSNPKEKAKTVRNSKYRLVQVSGRTEEAVNYFLDRVEENRDDEEFLALVDEVHKINCEGHSFRGYTILGGTPKREISRYTKRKPIWLIYAGMGSQWVGMGRDLMRNEIFRNTIKRCADALKPYNVNLEDILTNPESNSFDDSLNCFSGIGAVEIAMTDLLYSLGIVPDGIAGHSLGEVGCSYADGQTTPEEAVLLAFARGYATKCVELPAGLMAAVGLSKDECLKILPDDIFIACQNGQNSITISGPEKSTTDFVNKLSSQGIFAKKVNSGGIAYHTKYMRDAGLHLNDFVKKILKSTPRSSKWVSTSVAENQKNEHWAHFNCAEYHTNNFTNPVLFNEVYKHIPKDAIVIEVAPHGLMQAILKRELDSSVTILPLANRNFPDNEEWFLSTIGKIYLAGGQPNLRSLYSGVSFPVSRGTKMLSPLVKWDHSSSWLVPLWSHKDSFGQIIRVNLSNPQYAYLAGHNIDGRVLMPAIGYLELAWRTLARLHLKDIETFPVIIENASFKRATVLTPNTEVEFLVNIIKESGYFEIVEGGSVVSTGKIHTAKNVSSAYYNANCSDVAADDYLPMKSEDIYKECQLRRFMYEGYFQGIKECDVQGRQGKIKWHGNFTSFLDTMLHLILICDTKRDLIVPTSIERVVIDPQAHLKLVAEGEDFPIFFNQNLHVVKSGGIEISGLDFSKVPQRKKNQENPILETYEFVPYEAINTDGLDLDTSLSEAVQIVLQNQQGLIKTPKIWIFSGDGLTKLNEKIKNILDKQPLVKAEYVEYNYQNKGSDTFDMVVLDENLLNEINVTSVIKHLDETGMILYNGDIDKVNIGDLNIVYKAMQGKSSVHLMRKSCIFPSKYSVVYVENSKFSWLDKIKDITRTRSNEVVYLVSQEDISGIVGLMKCLLTEPVSSKFKCILIQDTSAPLFSVNNEFYRNQLVKNFSFNILRNGRWGTFVHLPVKQGERREVEDASVSISTVGDLSTLNWVEQSSSYVKPNPRSQKVYVHYASLNFRDVMVATGKLQCDTLDEPTVPEINLGLEYAGISDQGKRVMGIVGYEGLSLQLQSDPGFTWEVPRQWSLDEAATVPCVYATCYYAMIIRGRMRSGESILIHAGAGGIGLSAIAIALSMGCTVFTTVGSQEKKVYLKKIYPQLKDEYIGHSRNSSFKKIIMEYTKGRGVDIVLNSLSGELFKESLACIAESGRFLEIGKVDFYNNTPIGSRIFLKNISFHGILLDQLFNSQSEVKEEIRDLLTKGIIDGVVKPLPRTIFKEEEVEEAFRFLSTGKHKGKVMIELRKEDPAKSLIRTISAIPKVFFSPHKSYILVGGMGGVGLELTDWLIKRGATKIILNTRNQTRSGYQSYCLRKWSKWHKITVKVNTCDTTTLTGAKDLISFANNLGSVGGVFNMALVLKDALIENQTPEMYEAVFKPKITSGFNMDTVTRRECPALDHFVVFSSIACGRGNCGQSNYGMANSALEQLCEKRKRENLPAIAIQWGAIADVGVIANTNIIDKLADYLVPQNISSCIEALEKFIIQNPVIASSVVLASKSDEKSGQSIRTPAEAVAHILMIRNIDLIDKTLTLAQLGLDSLMVAEIKQTLYRNYQLEVDIDEIRDLTFDKLIAMSEVEIQDKSEPLTNGTKEVGHETMTLMLSSKPIIEMNQNSKGSRNIFLLHPIEGHIEILRVIADQLCAVVYGLQCTRDTNFDNIQLYASYYIRQIKTIQPQGPYFLSGYSFGAALSIEIGLQLERSGELVQIVCLDGSPAYVKRALEDLFSKKEKCVDKSKTAILVHFASTFNNVNQNEVAELLEKTDSWEKQLQLIGDIVSRKTGLNAEDVAISADTYYKRCLAGFTYEPQGIFRGKVLLIRGDLDQVLSSADYDLQKICESKVEILKLKGDHITVLHGENSRIISKKINALLL